MKNNKGYTVVELIIVIAVVGIFAFVAINKASYAFSEDIIANEHLVEQKIKLIENQAIKYAEENSEIFGDSDTAYIRVMDLIDANYILDSDFFENNKDVTKSQKIKIVNIDNKIKAHLEK
ncbi:MAG: prepilin-type N-terminal cleavage/methylation domain-containing protein [Bacilli bacterium]|nr:prepilin-type N-terminal cleavage/methylation domain-containing protein [Bacilli bacterium]